MLQTSVLVFSGGKCLGMGGVIHQVPFMSLWHTQQSV